MKAAVRRKWIMNLKTKKKKNRKLADRQTNENRNMNMNLVYSEKEKAKHFISIRNLKWFQKSTILRPTIYPPIQ